MKILQNLVQNSRPNSQKFIPKNNKKYASLTKSVTIFKENIQKMDIIHKDLFRKI